MGSSSCITLPNGKGAALVLLPENVKVGLKQTSTDAGGTALTPAGSGMAALEGHEYHQPSWECFNRSKIL